MRPAVQQLTAAGIAVSLFLDPDSVQVRQAINLRVPIIELHTGDFCEAKSGPQRDDKLARLRAAAVQAHGLGLRVAAGHGIDYHNIHAIMGLPHVEELNIGHSIIARAIFVGLEAAVREMGALIRNR